MDAREKTRASVWHGRYAVIAVYVMARGLEWQSHLLPLAYAWDADWGRFNRKAVTVLQLSLQ